MSLRTSRLIAIRRLPSRGGEFVIALDIDGDLACGWASDAWPTPAVPERRDLLPELSRRLSRYLRGAADDFRDVPLPRGSEFQRACWSAARSIPRGETIGYEELATRAGRPGAARAAGQAMRGNPTPILVPCHRVVAAGGRLHGYAGSTDPKGRELGHKAWLLALERR